jgi:hypothetical protein
MGTAVDDEPVPGLERRRAVERLDTVAGQARLHVLGNGIGEAAFVLHQVGPVDRQPGVVDALPVLVLNGEAEPQSPPTWTAGAISASSSVVVCRRGGQTVRISDRCVTTAMASVMRRTIDGRAWSTAHPVWGRITTRDARSSVANARRRRAFRPGLLRPGLRGGAAFGALA